LRPFNSRKPSWGVSSAWLRHASERVVNIKSCGRWGYHRSLFSIRIYIYACENTTAIVGFACGLWKSIHFGAQHGRSVSHDVFWNAFSGDSSLFWTIWFCVVGSLEKSVSPNEAWLKWTGYPVQHVCFSQTIKQWPADPLLHDLLPIFRAC
jgi:hypothetical protein